MRRVNPARYGKSGASRSRQSRQRRDPDEEVPQVYQEMLAEAEARESQATNDPPTKKRKVNQPSGTPLVSRLANEAASPQKSSKHSSQSVQTVYDTTTSDESDMEWEEVDLQQAHPGPAGFHDPEADDAPMEITLNEHNDKKRKVIPRRKPITGAERKLRLDVHKVHLLCLLRHVQIRNNWCNDEEVQKFLKQMLPKQTLSLLNPPEDKPQYTKSTTFMDGLNKASDAFMKRFRVTQPGLKRAHWVDDPSSLRQRAGQIMLDPEVILSREDFQKQARTLKGSRDFGAQLFCALLRSVAVEARLVCSLQPLPFSGITKNVSPVKLNLQYISLSSDMYDTSTDEQSGSPASPTPPSKSRRLARPQFRASRPFKTTVAASRPSTRESAYPVFWVEALNEAVQKWIPVDPLVTKSLAKTFKFEPPSSDPYNVMSYVVAFEDDASMRDVTRRYAKAFNAKTRKLRVESTKGGEAWWKRVLLFYEKPFLEDRDEMEISELTAKTAAEPMPRNVADFKDHPIYALERHLRRNEVIFPKRVIGQVGLGKSGSTHEKLEPVYRRSDVHVLRSADKWYRLGREIKIGEQPLKRVPARGNNILDDEDSETVTETSLYSFSQTELYRPPPVIQGKIPKNVYGNLDIYVSTMVPPGGVHVKHSDAAHAARILGIDYADAVTGFDFKGRHGTAVFQGAVVASEYHEALNEVLQGLEYEKANAKQEERSAEALRFWRYFLLKLRIAERVKGYAIEGEEAEDEEDGGMSDDSYANSEDYGGGFIPELDQLITTPQAGLDSTKLVSQEPSTENNTLPDSRIEDACRGGFLLDKDTNQRITLRSDGNSGPTSRNHLTERPRYSLVVIPNDKIDGLEENVSRKDTSVSPKASNFDLQQQNMKSADDEANNMQGSLEAPIMVESSTGADSKSTSVEVLSRAPSQTQSRVPSPEASEDESGSNEGSLLSHDPEDDDAIPEWLMSD